MFDQLREWIADQTGLLVIWANGNGPAPARPYIVLSLTAITAVGWDTQGSVKDGKQISLGERTAGITVTYYASPTDGPNEAILRLGNLRSLIRAGADLGVAVFGDAVVTSVPQLLQAEWQPQAVLQMTVGFRVRTEIDMAWIERVMGTATVSGRRGPLADEPFDMRIGS